MHHAITVGGLLLTLGIIGGVTMLGIGALMLFAEGMSDAPDAGTGSAGCGVLAVGAVTTVLCIVGLFV